VNSKKIFLLVSAAIISLVVSGCTDSIEQAIDDFKNGDSEIIRTAGVIRYSDGIFMGATREEAQVNGGFQVYHIGTGEVNGFIRLDRLVNDKNGQNLGMCLGGVLSESGLLGDCSLSVASPNQSVPTVGQPQTPAPTTPAGCEDRRDGTFDVTWNRPTCESHGYFYCTLNNICTDQTVNINQCLGR